MLWQTFGLLLGLVVRATRGVPSEQILIDVEEGSLRGTTKTSVLGQKYYSFQGIPYGLPPVDELRFTDPQPYGPWKRIWDATKKGPVCMTVDYATNVTQGSEDCLYLNVFTPQNPKDGYSKLAVMVWLHGGGYDWGMGATHEDFYGPDYLIQHDVIVVTINYRLHVMGFLSTADAVVPGNMGFKDQVLALRWINRNIKHFGGDPGRVTLFGERCGGVFVNMHQMTAQSKGLFQRAIAMSGTVLAPWAIKEDSRDTAYRLGEYLGCNSKDSEELVRCLRKHPADVVLRVNRNALAPEDRSRIFVYAFPPSLEPNIKGAYFYEDPLKLLKEGRFAQVPFMTGFTSNEAKAILKLSRILGNETKRLSNFPQIIARDLKVGSPQKQVAAAKAVERFYFGRELKTVSADDLEAFTLAFTDLYFAAGHDQLARLMASRSSKPVHMYQLSFEGNVSTPLDNFRYDGKPMIPGVQHEDTVAYLFARTDSPPQVVDLIKPEDMVRYYMSTIWTNFAKTGEPTPRGDSLIRVVWPVFTKYLPAFLDIDQNLAVGVDVNKYRLQFWRDLYGGSRY